MKMWKKCAAALLACAALALSACAGQAAEPAAAQPLDKEALVKSIGALTGSDGPLFDAPAQPDAAELQDIYGIDTGLFEDSLILIDQKWNFCIMVSPAEGKSNDVKNMMSTSLSQLAQQLELYEPEQCQRVADRMETMRGSYLIYIASGDSAKVLAEIEKALE